MHATSRHENTEHAIAVRLKAPGTCGELMQGAIDGQDFLVNCPINLFSRAIVHPLPDSGLRLQDLNQFTKIRDVIALASYVCGFKVSHRVSVASDIPRGKGMASSSADITAALEAVCRSSGVSLSTAMFARIVTEVEPSDCVHFPGIAHVNHLTGELVDSMPSPNDMNVLIVDCGGEIDTIGFDRERARGVYRHNQPELAGALKLLKRGLREGDASAVAEAATRSARLSQQIHFKPQFDDLLAKTRELGALGVNCAHSGTVLGVLYRSSDRLKDMLLNNVERTFGNSVSIIGDFKIISGGCYEC